MSEFVNKINAAFEDRTPREVHAEAWGKTLYIFPLTMLQLETINKESQEILSRIVEEKIINRANR